MNKNNNIKIESNINNSGNKNSQEQNENNNLINSIKERIDKKKYEKIGSGEFCEVYKIEYNNRIYAVKHL